jgi:NNP family nitrate/nitrite transporter-like MFS transporter
MLAHKLHHLLIFSLSILHSVLIIIKINKAALYFKEEFELTTEAAAAIASLFGWMNLFARGLGGFFSDISNAYLGMRGRLIWQFLCFALEGQLS